MTSSVFVGSVHPKQPQWKEACSRAGDLSLLRCPRRVSDSLRSQQTNHINAPLPSSSSRVPKSEAYSTPIIPSHTPSLTRTAHSLQESKLHTARSLVATL